MATTQKSVQISADLFVQLISYHLYGRQDPELAKTIRQGLDAKLDALARRDLYTESKTAPTAEARERARQAYLDAVGVREDWRW